MFKKWMKILPFFLIEWLAYRKVATYRQENLLVYRVFENSFLCFPLTMQCECASLKYLHYHCDRCGKDEKLRPKYEKLN